MSIDPNIALNVRPVQVESPIEQYGKMLSLKNLMTQGQMQQQAIKSSQIQNQQAELQMKEDADFKEAIRSGKSPEEIVAASPSKGLAYQKTVLEMQKSRIEHAMSQAKVIGQFLGSAKDQSSWESGLSELKGLGIDVGKVSPIYDPSIVASYQAKGMETKDQLEEAHKKVTEQLALSEEQRKKELFQPQKSKAENEAITSKPNEAGLTPYQAAEVGKSSQHPITIDIGGKPVPAVQEIKRDGTSRVLYQGKELANAKIYHAPNMALLNKDEIEPILDRVAKELASGDLTRIKDISSLRGDQRIRLYDKVKAITPKFSTAEIDRKIKMQDSVDTGDDSKQIRSFGTFLEHAGAAKESLDGIYQSNSKYWNKPINWWRENMSGDPDYQAFITSLEPVRKEFEGFLLGGRALYGDDRKSAEIILSNDSGPGAINAALKAMGHTASARFNEINFRYKRLMGKDIEDPFAPEAIQGASKIGIKLKGDNQGGGSSVPVVGGSFNGQKVLKVTRVE